MSMHEFEDLVEQSVHTLAKSGRPASELRSLYWNLYEFEGEWDTGFTHFRNIDELVSARFVYEFELAEHPDFESHRAYFDALDQFEFIKVPGSEADGGYYQPKPSKHLYFDAGSSLWKRFVELGKLTGADAEPPRKIDIYEVVLDVAKLAEKQGDRELIAMGYRLLAPHAMMSDELEDLKRNRAVADLRELVKRSDALSIEMDYGMLVQPAPEDLDEDPVLGWWFGL